MEESEREDWKIIPTDDYDTRMKKSVEAYYMDRWYEAMKPFTPETRFYDEIPDVMPFEKCMVKYSNKSPKDSEFWGPVTTPDEARQQFDTSLRCQSRVCNVICIRRWIDGIVEEYRCFWNRRLVAISVTDAVDDQSLIAYINTLPIPFWRCVFDIAKLSDGSYIFIEFNSFETNSGGHRFHWHDDHEILYGVDGDTVTIRGITDHVIHNQLPKPLATHGITFTQKPSELTILPPERPSCWVITKKYIYIHNDKYLGRFTHDLQNVNWKVGNFRFCVITYAQGELTVGSNRYYEDLSPIKSKSLPIVTHQSNFWYGFDALWQGNPGFVRLHYSGVFEFFLKTG